MYELEALVITWLRIELEAVVITWLAGQVLVSAVTWSGVPRRWGCSCGGGRLAGNVVFWLSQGGYGSWLSCYMVEIRNDIESELNGYDSCIFSRFVFCSVS